MTGTDYTHLFGYAGGVVEGLVELRTEATTGLEASQGLRKKEDRKWLITSLMPHWSLYLSPARPSKVPDTMLHHQPTGTLTWRIPNAHNFWALGLRCVYTGASGTISDLK